MHVIQSEKDFQLKPSLELVIIHTDGKIYETSNTKKGVTAQPKIVETRMTCHIELLDDLIAQLQLQRRSLDQLTKNTAILNQIAKSIIEDIPKEQPTSEQKTIPGI